jgi:hypothetical protein
MNDYNKLYCKAENILKITVNNREYMMFNKYI